MHACSAQGTHWTPGRSFIEGFRRIVRGDACGIAVSCGGPRVRNSARPRVRIASNRTRRMVGAIAGDIIGSVYERRPTKM